MMQRFKRLYCNYVFATEEYAFERRFSLFRKLMRLQLNVTWDEVNRVYLINDGHDNLVISKPLRMHYYQNGISNRLDFLASEYFCNLIDFTDTDIVIDVGANIGELSIALTKKANIRVIAIEPEEREFRALEHNLKK